MKENAAELFQAVSRFDKARILVIGDVIVDQFIWGRVDRISPEAPVPVVNVNREEFLLGGSANVLKNIYSLGGRGALCGVIGSDAMGAELVRLVEVLASPVDGLVRGERPTTVKTRVVAQGQQVVRFDREETGVPGRATLTALIAYLERNLRNFDAVIVSDYSKGVVNEPFMIRLHQLRRAIIAEQNRPLPLIVDPKPENIHRFIGATVITPNNLEASRMSGMVISNEQQLLAASRYIRDEIDCEAVLITRGEAGMALLQGNDQLVTIPTMAKEVYDVTGAGDTVVATLALGLAAGCSMKDAAVLANHAAGIVVGKVGTASVSADELRLALELEV
ncbi:MAG: D-glycero-beta-D-manno-heptose-7-phosphate kinase [Desulfobulbaceae bacterium]|nr:D-glycero-beta-D-manno-heptose-7-phosphate kinase [Desulfobulbaceae bacterium]